MQDQTPWYVGIDWAIAEHQVCVIDADGNEHGQRSFPHRGSGLADMADWIISSTGAGPEEIAISIEIPHGPVVESLLDRGFGVHAINPKQLDRFRDRFFPAGSKDDRRDARVLADALRTDPQVLRKLASPNALTVELRELSRMAEELTKDRTRLGNRIRQQLWRYYPQILEISNNVAEPWILDLWQMAPTPESGQGLSRGRVTRLLKRHRIRRIDATGVLSLLGSEAITVAPGTTQAAVATIALVAERLKLTQRQLAAVNAQIDLLTDAIARGQEDALGERSGQRDVAILSSLPGVGRTVLATLLTEAHDPLARRDYRALRSLCGVAPITKRSGKSMIVTRRHAVHRRLANAMYHWARVAVQHDPVSRRKYDSLRRRGHRHARALRSVADRLLAVACAMLRNQSFYRPEPLRRDAAAA